jgi:hypothetical protein
MKSPILTPVPTAVVTAIFPDDADAGAVNEREVSLATVAAAATPLSFTVVAPAAVSNAVPVTVTKVFAAPDAGLNPVIVGAPATVTVNGCALVAVDAPTVTEIGPVVAPLGTMALIEPLVAEFIVATVPLNITVLFAGTGSNPLP